jgi:AmiR/NasT family two-component response regulator
MSADRGGHRLRVLIASPSGDRLDDVVAAVTRLGHDVVARSLAVEEAAAVTAEVKPDVALVREGGCSARALGLIGQIARQLECPVIAVLDAADQRFVAEAAKMGAFAYVTDRDPEQLQGTIDIVSRRFAEFRDLEGAVTRRAVIERAKGILMERHGVDDDAAFEMLRVRARSSNTRVVDLAAAVVDGHALLPGSTGAGA